jgi:peroxiredoxin
MIQVVVLLGLLAGVTQERKPLGVGDTVPDFEVKDLSGKLVKLSELRKSTESGLVSLTFWCTFCHSCRHMDAPFDALASDLKGKAAVVALDASVTDNAASVEKFTRAKKFGVPVYLDAGGKVADLFGVKVTTTTIVIDKAGIVRYRGHFEGQQGPHARKALEALLGGKDVEVKESAPKG